MAGWQLGLLHSAPASIGVDEDMRKLVQKNVGGAWSAAQMSAAGFARVMAFWEARGWVDGRNGPGHWQRVAASAAPEGDAMRKKVIKLAWLLGLNGPDERVDYKRLDGFCRRMFPQAAGLNGMEPDDLHHLIDVMQTMVDDGADLADSADGTDTHRKDSSHGRHEQSA